MTSIALQTLYSLYIGPWVRPSTAAFP